MDGIPYGTISFINWINRKSYTQHTYTIFFINFCNTLRVSMCSGYIVKKLLYIFIRIIDINERFNVRSTISYYNVEHIKDNIYDVEGKGNYFR